MTRVQRYRVTTEFTLRDRGDYATYRAMIENFFKLLGDRVGCQSDYCSIEKVKENETSYT